MNKREGSRLKAGLIDSSLGRFVIEKIRSDRILGTYKPILAPKPRFPEVHILLAINRPPTVRKILQLAGTWGVASIRFFISKNSRKEYLTSPVWNRSEIESELIEGMEQGKNIFLPKVSCDFENRPETILLEKSKETDFTFRLILDRKGLTLPQIVERQNSSSAAITANTAVDSADLTLKSHSDLRIFEKENPIRILVAIGPESGFVRNEIDFWKRNGFTDLNLSTQVLRTETAVAFLLARLEEKSLFLKS